MKSGIYKITNTINGRVYIGRAKYIQARWKRHQRELAQGKHHNQQLQADWTSNGSSAFSFEVIEHCEDNQQLLNDREAFWMRAYEAFTKGYNILTDKNDFSGLKHSEETKQKMRQKRNEWYKDHPEHKEKMSELRKEEWASGQRVGKPKTTEQKLNASTRRKHECQGNCPFTKEAQAKGQQVRIDNPDVFRTKIKQAVLDQIRNEWTNRTTELPMQFCRRQAQQYNVSVGTIKCIVYRMKSYKNR